MVCSLTANVGDEELAEIKSLEQAEGMTLLAFSCYDLRPAPASDEQLAKIKQLEERLGVTLVAVAS
jgi:hypothetical protein